MLRVGFEYGGCFLQSHTSFSQCCSISHVVSCCERSSRFCSRDDVSSCERSSTNLFLRNVLGILLIVSVQVDFISCSFYGLPVFELSHGFHQRAQHVPSLQIFE